MGESTAAARVHCGVAGWSYPDWDGVVYPAGTRDKLRYLAGYVDAIEINNTFYRPPAPRTALSWLRRVEDLPHFFFTAKLHQDITHRGRLERPTVEAFHRAFEPLAGNRKLRHLLAQFRYDFRDSPDARRHLRAVRDAFAGLCNLVLELRHNSWQSPDALGYLASLEVTVANLDYPMSRDAFTLRHCTVGKDAYFRLHGRNAGAWFSKSAGRDETYNYRYSDHELDEILERTVRIAEMSNSLTLIANNHYQGKEAVNVLQLKSRLTRARVPVPPALLDHYPELRQLALAVDTPRLPFADDATEPGAE